MDIAEIDQSGLVVLEFTEPMYDETNSFDMSLLKESLELSIENSVTEEVIEFEWIATSFKNSELKIQLQFANPLEIGTSDEGDDILMVKVTNSAIFKTQDFFSFDSYLEENSYQLERRLTKQMKNDAAS